MTSRDGCPDAVDAIVNLQTCGDIPETGEVAAHSSSVADQAGTDKGVHMPYQAEISRGHPTAFLFVVDQSASMQAAMSNGISKAQQVADVVNRTLFTLVTRCTKAEGTRDYFEVGVLGYGGSEVRNGLQGNLAGAVLHPISRVEASPLRVDERLKKVDDGAGGLVEQSFKFPIWFDPQASGVTPMCQAMYRAADELADWCDAHPGSYPPTVLHVTDGESTDGNPEQLAERLCQLETEDGAVLMLTLHLSTAGNDPVRFPAAEAGLPDEYAKMLFRMSSPLPDRLKAIAQEEGLQVETGSKGFIFNADVVEIVQFFDIGTRASELR